MRVRRVEHRMKVVLQEKSTFSRKYNPNLPNPRVEHRMKVVLQEKSTFLRKYRKVILKGGSIDYINSKPF